jgi:hypothetical protein
MKLIVNEMPWEETGWTLHKLDGAEVEETDLPPVGDFEIRADDIKIGEITLWPNP